MTASMTSAELTGLPAALTVPQAAAILGIGRSHAYQAVKSGDWPTEVIRVGRCIRIPAAEILRLADRRGMPSIQRFPASTQPRHRHGPGRLFQHDRAVLRNPDTASREAEYLDGARPEVGQDHFSAERVVAKLPREVSGFDRSGQG
jgi:excisionase family DNA binding protein